MERQGLANIELLGVKGRHRPRRAEGQVRPAPRLPGSLLMACPSKSARTADEPSTRGGRRAQHGPVRAAELWHALIRGRGGAIDKPLDEASCETAKAGSRHNGI